MYIRAWIIDFVSARCFAFRHFFHRFLENILIFRGHRLQSLHIHTLLPLDRPLYVQTRDGTPNLASIIFSGNIQWRCAKPLEIQHRWASGQTGSLKRPLLTRVKEAIQAILLKISFVGVCYPWVE